MKNDRCLNENCHTPAYVCVLSCTYATTCTRTSTLIKAQIVRFPKTWNLTQMLARRATHFSAGDTQYCTNPSSIRAAGRGCFSGSVCYTSLQDRQEVLRLNCGWEMCAWLTHTCRHDNRFMGRADRNSVSECSRQCFVVLAVDARCVLGKWIILCADRFVAIEAWIMQTRCENQLRYIWINDKPGEKLGNRCWLKWRHVSI